jgi:hypothetical protein
MESSQLRSRPARLLTLAGLLLTLVFGVTFVALHHIKDLRGEAVQSPGAPLSDDQAQRQVVGSAREFVTAARLRNANGTYILVSCTESNGPPYQGTGYVTFDVPSITRTPAYFREIVRLMAGIGWAEGLPPNHHPGGKLLTKQGVSAFVYRSPDLTDRGVLQLYGECRNMTDHRADPAGFVDITRMLNQPN